MRVTPTRSVYPDLSVGCEALDTSSLQRTVYDVLVNTSTDINRQLQSRDMTDDIVANQTNVNTRITAGPVTHEIAAGLEFSSERSLNLRTLGISPPSG